MHHNSRYMFEKHAATFFEAGQDVLEVGPDSRPSTVRNLVGDRVGSWKTADLEAFNMVSEHDYLMPDEYTLPIDDESFDLVVSTNVMEHVRKPWRWVPELARVLRPGGLMITVVPLNWPYHASPYDCWRIYPDGLRSLYDDAGLETVLAEFDGIDDGRESSQTTFEMRKRDARVFVKRALGRPAWPWGAFESKYAVDTVGVARKPTTTSLN